MSLAPAAGRQRQANLCEFKDSQGYTQRNPVLKEKRKEGKERGREGGREEKKKRILENKET